MNPTSSRDRLEKALARIADQAGEGARACLTVYVDTARAAADAADRRARANAPLGPLDGAIVSIKDLFDVKGEVTRAGSRVVAEEGVAAAADAPVVTRLRGAGAVIVAKTNMSEFAFSGVGANPHYGTPGNPLDRARVPGGSTSGGGVAVADGMCDIAIGSDTGGSTRIPAALCGIVGYKPSKQRIPTDGAFPLSFTLDSIGPMAKTVSACAEADAVMAGQMPLPLEPRPLAGLRIGIMQGMPFESMDSMVAKAWEGVVAALGKAGAKLSDETIELVPDMIAANAKGGFAPTEAFAIHRERLGRRAGDIDQYIRARIERGGAVPAYDYIEMVQERTRLVRVMDTRLSALDVLALPTCPIVAPRLDEVASTDTFARNNMLLLRNTSLGNFFDLCGISLPVATSGGVSAGFMLLARNGSDGHLFNIAAALEHLLAHQ
jgi:aspartyl-tRNA(Asn)/glutamyl-tRNA(Gln) amidotransferase subunit A